jgi:hypothetical protein
MGLFNGQKRTKQGRQRSAGRIGVRKKPFGRRVNESEKILKVKRQKGENERIRKKQEKERYPQRRGDSCRLGSKYQIQKRKKSGDKWKGMEGTRVV